MYFQNGADNAVMRASAACAVHAALDELARLGFTRAGIEGRAIEWWIEGPHAAYEGASIGLAMALATVSLLSGSGAMVDPCTVVSGAVEGAQVLPVSAVASKFNAVLRTVCFTRLLLPRPCLVDLPPEARTNRAISVVPVSTLREAIGLTMGLALGLAQQHLAATAPSPAAADKPHIDIWIEAESLPDASVATRGISIEPSANVQRWSIGDAIRVGIRGTDTLHIALLNIGASGRIHCLIPNQSRPQMRILPYDAVFFPDQQDDMRFVLSEPAGLEQLVVVATRGPILAALPALSRFIDHAAEPSDLYTLLADPKVEAYAAASFFVEPSAGSLTRSLDGARRASPWCSFDLG